MILDWIINGNDAGFLQSIAMIAFSVLACSICILIRNRIYERVTGIRRIRFKERLPYSGLSVVLMLFFSSSWTPFRDSSGVRKGTRAKGAFLSLLATGLTGLVFQVLYCFMYAVTTKLYGNGSDVGILVWINSLLYTFAIVFVSYFLFELIPFPGLDCGLILSALLRDERSDRFVSALKYSYVLCLFLCLFFARSGIAEQVSSSVLGFFGTPMVSLFTSLMKLPAGG